MRALKIFSIGFFLFCIAASIVGAIVLHDPLALGPVPLAAIFVYVGFKNLNMDGDKKDK